MSIPNKVLDALSASGLLGADILAAVSGGVNVLKEAADLHGGRLEIAHVDHGLRPCSGEDAAFCEALARKLDAPFHALTLKLSDFRNSKPSQAEARRLRREFFLKIMTERRLSATALGHNLDDQIETVLFRLIRGTGPRGAAGMAVWSPPWLRPLLDVRRVEIEALAGSRGWKNREDPTNKKNKYTRNKIRLDLMPAIRAIHGSPEKSIARFVRLAADDDQCLSEEAHRKIRALAAKEPEGYRISADKLSALHPALRRRIYLALWQAVGCDVSALEMKHVETIEKLLEKGSAHRTAPLPGPGAFVRSYGDLWVLKPGSVWLRPVNAHISQQGRHSMGGLDFDLVWSPSPSRVEACIEIPDGRGSEGLWVRSWAPGDKIALGSGRTKKVKDLLMEAKIPKWRRSRAVLVGDDAGQLGLIALEFAFGVHASGKTRICAEATSCDGL